MNKNRIYYFTGTGNSLYLAQEIAARIGGCEIVAIHKDVDLTVPQNLDRVGFVFPVYFWGLPVMVANFLRNAAFKEQNNSYFFAVATYGGLPGNALSQAKKLLYGNAITLNYGAGVRSFSNGVSFYKRPVL